jgi:hypothetical protein
MFQMKDVDSNQNYTLDFVLIFVIRAVFEKIDKVTFEFNVKYGLYCIVKIPCFVSFQKGVVC